VLPLDAIWNGPKKEFRCLEGK